MSDSIVTNRYAEALLEIGLEHDILDSLIDEMNIVREVFQSEPKLLNFLTHPKIKQQEKVSCIENSFKQFSKRVLHTLRLLVLRKRIYLIEAIIDAFLEQAYEHKGIGELAISTAKPLTEEQLDAITNMFHKKLNKKQIESTVEVDTDLIGGIKVRHKNTVYDGTIANQLERLRSSIRTVNY